MLKKVVLVFTGLLVVLLAAAGAAAWDVDDGTYQGKGSGYGGEVIVSVVITEGVISEIKVVEHNETPILSDAGFATTIARILAEQSLSVDTVSGATGTSQAVLDGVADALGIKQDVPDGTYQGKGQGYGGEVIVSVVVAEGIISEITIVEHNETPIISEAGFKTTIERILTEQSLEVDTVSGATGTSQAVLDGVADALANALAVEKVSESN